MPQNATPQIDLATVVKCAISATFYHVQLFEITDARKMKSPFFCNIHVETQKLWKRSAIRIAASRPDAVHQAHKLKLPTALDALGVLACRPKTSSALISKSR
jgi:hypothetical protein